MPESNCFTAEKLSNKHNHLHHPMKQSQRKRSRIVLLLALVLVLATLVLLANTFAPTIDAGYSNTFETTSAFREQRSSFSRKDDKRKQRPRQFEDRYHREIIVMEYSDVVQEKESNTNVDQHEEKELEVDHRDEKEVVDDRHNETEQRDEMEKYYKRYLEIFYEKHGHGYVPEDKELVYSEYLAYQKRKRREHSEQRKAAAMENQRKEEKAIEAKERKDAAPKQAAELRQHQNHRTSKVVTTKQQQSSSNQPPPLSKKARTSTDRAMNEEHRMNETVRRDGTPMETPRSRVVADRIMVKPAPYSTLEVDVTDIQKVTEDLYYGLSSNNYTDTITAIVAATTPTTIVVR